MAEGEQTHNDTCRISAQGAFKAVAVYRQRVFTRRGTHIESAVTQLVEIPKAAFVVQTESAQKVINTPLDGDQVSAEVTRQHSGPFLHLYEPRRNLSSTSIRIVHGGSPNLLGGIARALGITARAACVFRRNVTGFFAEV
jgi:hypothetical protein